MACLMEKEICGPLGCFITNQSLQLTINKQHRTDLDEILQRSHAIVRDVRVGKEKEFDVTANKRGANRTKISFSPFSWKIRS